MHKVVTDGLSENEENLVEDINGVLRAAHVCTYTLPLSRRISTHSLGFPVSLGWRRSTLAAPRDIPRIVSTALIELEGVWCNSSNTYCRLLPRCPREIGFLHPKPGARHGSGQMID